MPRQTITINEKLWILYLWRDRREDNPSRFQSFLSRKLLNVRFSDSREPQKPEDRVRYSLENVDPHVQCVWVNLVQLVEVTVHDRIVRQTILGSGCYHDVIWNLFSSRLFIVLLSEIRRLTFVWDKWDFAKLRWQFMLFFSNVWFKLCLFWVMTWVK